MRNFKKWQAGGRFYCIEAGKEEGEDPHAVVPGTFIVNTLPNKVCLMPVPHIPLLTRQLQNKLLVFLKKWI